MKNFDAWNEAKKKIDAGKRAPVRRGEVYWCRIGINVGVEQDGKGTDGVRPGLILKKFSNEIVLVTPLTTKEHSGDWYYHMPTFGENSYAVLNQTRPIDTKRLLSSMGEISESEISKIMGAYCSLIAKM